ncbi:MAG: dihydrofolate reductase [Lachnospiraceae bacterium]|nr:dihydrofolate reductase [Lachnospiraceae bacterium]
MISIIAAMAKNRVIGKDGKIPWQLPEDMKRFRQLTMGHTLVMGRRTYEEIGHPLPGRKTYVVSSVLNIEQEGCCRVDSLAEALRRAEGEEVFICGGAMLYKEALPSTQRLYMTELDKEVPGDTFFPEIPPEEFGIVEKEAGEGYCFVTYERKYP